MKFNKKGKIDNIISITIGLFIFTALIGFVNTQINSTQDNLTGGASVLLGF